MSVLSKMVKDKISIKHIIKNVKCNVLKNSEIIGQISKCDGVWYTIDHNGNMLDGARVKRFNAAYRLN